MGPTRKFACKTCDKTWETDLPGRFTTCEECKAGRLREARSKTCAYRNCGRPFQDESPKNGVKFCSTECGRREKAFRSGKATDESYFRVPGGSGKRKCAKCGDVFSVRPGETLGRCAACRSSLRSKTCLTCGSAFSDDSLKNNRRYCDEHSLVGSARAVYVSPSRSSARGLDLDDLSPFTMTWWGRLGEVLVLHLRPDFFDAVKTYGNRTPYDLYDRDLGKIAVKTAGSYLNKQGRRSWKFQLGGDARRCRTAFFLGFSEDKSRLERAWVLPFSELPNRLKVMSPGSKEYSPRGEMPPVEVDLMDRKFQSILRGLDARLPKSVSNPVADHALVGRVGELLYAALYPGSDHVSQREPSSRYDFQDADGTKVNVRTRRPEEDGSWKFAVPTGVESEVFYFLAMSPEGSEIEAAYRVPVRDVETGKATVCLTASWSPYFQEGFPRSVSSLVPLSEADRDQLFLSSRRLSELPRSELLDRAFRFHRRSGFPYPEIPSDEDLRNAVGSIRKYESVGNDLPITSAGLSVLSGYFPHRFESRNENSDFSAIGAFWDDERFLRALSYLAGSTKPSFTRSAVRGALTALNRTPGQFPPGVAKELVTRFCPPGGRVLDPCAGWGGRLVGTLVAGGRYFGIDASPRTSNALGTLGARLLDYLGRPPEDVEIVCGRAEATLLPAESFDFAMTSPPYWKRERYDAEESREYEAWKEGFLSTMIQNVYGALRPGSVFALNVSDYRDSGRVVPLVSDSKDSALRAGFLLETECRMEKHPSSSSRSYEPMLVFRKPSR